jgi:uncharacterized protein YjbI with pentapeptide repeats
LNIHDLIDTANHRAFLPGADLNGAWLNEADLTEADLRPAIPDGAITNGLDAFHAEGEEKRMDVQDLLYGL